MYTLLSAGGVQRDADQAIIPEDAGNRDRHDYEAWLAAGNRPAPAVGVPTMDELIDRAKVAIDTEAERQRCRYLTPGAGQMQEYQQIALEAAAVLAGDPEAGFLKYPLLAASIGIEVPRTSDDLADLRAVASQVQGRRAALYGIGVGIRRERLRLKAEAAAATTPMELSSVLMSAKWPEVAR